MARGGARNRSGPKASENSGRSERRGAAYLEGNFVTLLPSEERPIRVDWHGVEPADRRLRLTGWNVPARVLTHG